MIYNALKPISMVIAVLLVIAGKQGGSVSPSTTMSTSPQEQQTTSAPLVKLVDPNLVLQQLTVIDNPHLLQSARYLTALSATSVGNASRQPGVAMPSDTASALSPQSTQHIQAYPLMSALWKNPSITVCWENPNQAFAQSMKDVQTAITQTWQSASKLRFTSWSKCPTYKPSTDQVIRIQIADIGPNDGPRTLGLGNQLASVEHGMLLNFTFLHWGLNCQTMADYCVKAIAVHEFGHAIGLAHEQNRPDKAGECMEAPQGDNGDNRMLTPYDPDSVMNYCNKKYNNNGELSVLDKAAIINLYGAH